ncbi:MAG: hypothetical protein JW940_21140 [Polyangiaceae bacterium]|nr:hypothetical protein [Polyangiaceae bacterium]
MTRFIKRTGSRPGKVSDSRRKPGHEAETDFAPRLDEEASECCLLCEVGGDLFATMLFPIQHEVVTVTILLGPIGEWDDGTTSLSTVLDFFEKNVLLESKKQGSAKSMVANKREW